MGLPDVRIVLANGQLGGLVAFAEGVALMVGHGVSVVDGIQVGEPKVVFNLQEAEDLGIDVANNPTAHRHVKEFYNEAGLGRELYIMLVPNTMLQSQMVDFNEANGPGVKTGLTFAQGRVRMYGTFCDDPSIVPNSGISSGIDDDVINAVPLAQILGNNFASIQAPVRGVLEGRDFQNDAATLVDAKTLGSNRVAILIGSSKDDRTASIGMFLGRNARVPVHRKASRVKDGRLPITEAFVGTASAGTFGGLGLMHDKGYIVMRKFPTSAGYFFSGDPMCVASTDDYNLFARGRVIDKAHIIAYATFVEELDDEILIDADGKIESGVVATLEAKINNQINQLMTANREISGASATIDPNQNVLSTNKTVVVLKLRPVGYNSDIEVQLGFDNPNV
jgi:hypothetical protein